MIKSIDELINLLNTSYYDKQIEILKEYGDSIVDECASIVKNKVHPVKYKDEYLIEKVKELIK